MKDSTIITLLVILISFLLLNDAVADTWARSYGGANDEAAYSIIQTKDKNLIVAGTTGSFGSGADDIWILKIDRTGKILWQKTYGDASFESIGAISPTSDGGCIVLSMKLLSCCTDLWILKLDKFGNIDWQKTYGGLNAEESGSIEQTKDGGYIVVGTTGSFGAGDSDIWVMKLDVQGNIIWQNAYGTPGYEAAYSVVVTKQNGCIVVGMIYRPSGLQDALVLRLDSSGNVLWSNSFGSFGEDVVYSVDHASGRNYIVFGRTNSLITGAFDFWALKLNRRGKVLWQRRYGGSDFDLGQSVERTPDGGHVFAGYTSSPISGESIAFLKLDHDGHANLQKNFGGSETEQAYSVVATSDGGFAVAGFTRSFGAGNADIWVLKLDSCGKISDSCVYESETSITETNSMMDISNIPLTMTTTSGLAIDTSVIPVDSSAEIDMQCSD